MSTAEIKFADHVCTIDPAWTSFAHETVFRCHVVLWPEDDGGYSAHCANLAGVISQGDTAEEAIENIEEAFRETLAYYRESGSTPPWDTVAIDRPQGYIERWLTVRA